MEYSVAHPKASRASTKRLWSLRLFFVKLLVEREDNMNPVLTMESGLTPAKQEEVDALIRKHKGKNAVEGLLYQRIGSKKYSNYQQYYLSNGGVMYVNLDGDPMTVKVSEPDSKTAKTVSYTHLTLPTICSV